MIGTITVRFWHSVIPEAKIEDKKQYPYTKRRRNQLIDKIIAAGLNVMIQTVTPSEGDGFMIIWIDKYRFGQR